MALKGAAVLSLPPSRKAPITLPILTRMFQVLSGWENSLMLCSAMSLAFFACLRSGEFCVRDPGGFDKDKHLCVGDVKFLGGEMFSLYLKSSKTDTYSTGVTIFVGCSGGRVCAFCSLKAYLVSRGSPLPFEPLFVDLLGNVLSRAFLVSTVKMLVAILGLEPGDFSGHSFRAGSATTAAAMGFDHWEIKSLGRWTSEAYGLYIRNPELTASFAKRLSGNI